MTVGIQRAEKTNRPIENDLKIPWYTVDYNVIKFLKVGTKDSTYGGDKRKVTTKQNDKYILYIKLRNRRLTAAEINSDVQKHIKKLITISTTRRRLFG